MNYTEVAHLYFPNDLHKKNGYLIGYNVKGLIATIIDIDNENDVIHLIR